MNCNSILNGLYKQCKSLGGIKEIKFAKKSDIGQITLNEDNNYIASFEYPQSFVKYQLVKQTANLSCNYNVDSKYWENNLSFYIPKLTSAQRRVLENLSESEVVAVVTDNNGRQWFLGYNNPLIFNTFTASSGTSFGDKNGYDISLTDISQNPPYEVNPFDTSRTLGITSNGVYDVFSYDRVSVDVKVECDYSEDDLVLQFIDYEGSIRYAYTYEDAQKLDALPPVMADTPTCTSEGWNYSLAEIKDFLQKYPHFHLIVGAQYRVKDDTVRFGYIADDDNRSPIYRVKTTDGGSINWGDGTIDNFSSGTAVLSHTYTANGLYNAVVSGDIKLFYITPYNQADFLQTQSFHLKYLELPATLSVVNFSTMPTSTYPYFSEGFEYLIISKGITRIGISANYITQDDAADFGTGTTGIIQNTRNALQGLQFKYVTIPDSVQCLGRAVFNRNTHLQKISIPYNLKEISSVQGRLFNTCTQLLYANFPNVDVDSDSYIYITESTILKEVILPKYTDVGNQLNISLPALTRVYIPDSLQDANYVFNSAPNIEYLRVSSNLTSQIQITAGYKLKECDLSNTQIIKLNTNSLNNAPLLKTLKLPATCFEVGGSVAANSPQLETLVAPTLDLVGAYFCALSSKISPFRDVPNLADAGGYCFSQSNTPDLVIPDTFVGTGQRFCGDQNLFLKKLTIGKGLIALPNNFIVNCYNLKEIHFTRTTPPQLASSILNIFSFGQTSYRQQCTIYVPAGYLQTYQSTTNYGTWDGLWAEE